jgi:hypothetical protein
MKTSSLPEQRAISDQLSARGTSEMDSLRHILDAEVLSSKADG